MELFGKQTDMQHPSALPLSFSVTLYPSLAAARLPFRKIIAAFSPGHVPPTMFSV